MPERTVQLGSMFYIDEDGAARRGECGDKVKVNTNFVKKFDSLNHLATEEDALPAGTVVAAPEAPTEEYEQPRRAAVKKSPDKDS